MLEKLKPQKKYSKDQNSQMRPAYEFKRKFLWNIFIITSITFFTITCFSVTMPSAESVADSCIQCHSNPSFLVTDKKLYKYFRDWESSTHALENITCTDCHGGDPSKTDKKNAHGKDIQQILTPVKYDQISVTCGKCHQDNADSFRKSRHYRILTETDHSTRYTPTCVTCHGSINTSIPRPDDIAKICTSCHNAITENNPEIPEAVSYLIERLMFINYYTRVHIFNKNVLKKDPEFFTRIKDEFSELSQIWHTLDLNKIEEKTMRIRIMLSKERKLLNEKNEK